VLHVLSTEALETECVVIRRGQDLVIMMAESLLTSRGATLLTHVLSRSLPELVTPPPA
jgi:hypothetical protein